jgi:hypothetical protein
VNELLFQAGILVWVILRLVLSVVSFHLLSFPFCIIRRIHCHVLHALIPRVISFNFLNLYIVTKFFLELLYTNVWGPSPVCFKTGFKYYVYFIDDYSRYSWLFPIMRKSDVLPIFSLVSILC